MASNVNLYNQGNDAKDNKSKGVAAQIQSAIDILKLTNVSAALWNGEVDFAGVIVNIPNSGLLASPSDPGYISLNALKQPYATGDVISPTIESIAPLLVTKGAGEVAAGEVAVAESSGLGLAAITTAGTANSVSGARLSMQLSAEQAAGALAPTSISSYANHALQQILGRDGGIGVSQAALDDAFANPTAIQYVPSKYGPTFKYIGQNATVVIIQYGNVVTTWGTSAAWSWQMKLVLTDRQKDILSGLRLKDSGKNAATFDSLDAQEMTSAEIDVICGLINAEFMAEGILPTFEPNKYGLELERLINLINRPRVKT